MGKYRVSREPVVQPQDQSIKFIPLTKGQVAIIDAADFDKVNKINWNAQWSKFTQSFYARGNHGGPLMHRFVMDLNDKKIECDHRDGNSLDNRKDNLRLATKSQNGFNSVAQKNSKSGYPGVNLHKRRQVWEVNITFNGKRIHVGSAKDKDVAIEMRKDAEKKYHGEFAYSSRNHRPTPMVPLTETNESTLPG